ncbi:Dabb family protein [Streptomyces sp. JV176]|uniref:Dabb family protein n=1 Tax=Streptomyces sp. JV176 TaxID=858630 RepID=UPI002E7AA383|nr:Dabb family protein [Streptomyces sp. JV176]MEE1797443.1 Dabb family protein [Streptomyces sp. JV176]
MIVNILRFSFKDGTTEDEKAAVLATMRRISTLESTSFGVVGQDLGDPAEGYTHTYCVGVEDLAALERYMNDRVLIEGDLGVFPHLQRLSPVRLSDDMDPGLAEKIMELHLARVARSPEWARLLDTIPDTSIATTR